MRSRDHGDNAEKTGLTFSHRPGAAVGRSAVAILEETVLPSRLLYELHSFIWGEKAHTQSGAPAQIHIVFNFGKSDGLV